MGGSQSRRDESFRASEWEQAYDIQIPPQCEGQYTVVRNRISGELLDKYSLQFPNEKQYNKYLQSIAYRRNQPNIVRVVHFEPAVVKQFCGSSFLLNVYLEHCKSRLSQYEDIPFPDYLYCAMAMLDGYKKLYGKIGRFQVVERQVMIDNEGEIRVWLNSDFSQNQAEDLRNDHYRSKNPNQQEYQMVQDIMRVIFENSDLSEGPGIKLADFYQRQKNSLNHRVGFEEAKSIIHEYSRVNQIQIPNLFKSVYEIYEAQADQRQYQDTMSFKNQLLNQDQHQNPNSSQLGVHYQPVNSVISNHPVSNSFAHRPQPVFHSDSQSNISPRIASSNLTNNHIVSNRSGPLNVPHYGFGSQPSIAPSIQPHFVSSIPPHHQNIGQPRPVYPQYLGASNQPPFQHPIAIKPPQQGFPIVIRPPAPNVQNNISINRNPIAYPVQPFQNFSSPRQANQILNINRPGVPFPNNQPIQQLQPIFNQMPNNSPKSGIKIDVPARQQRNLKNNQINQNNINNKFGSQQQDEAQIEKNILKHTTNNIHDDINEANIIRDLSELHKIQQQQKSKRSGNPDTSRNFRSNNSEYERQKSNEHILQTDEHQEVDSPRKYNRNDYYQQAQNQNQQHENQRQQGNQNQGEDEHEEDKFNFQAGYVTQDAGQYGTTNYYQPSTNNTATIKNNQTNTANQINKIPVTPYFQNSPAVRHQISQPQYSGFNPQPNGSSTNYNSVQLNKINNLQFKKSNQAYIINNQINQMNHQYFSQDSITKGHPLSSKKQSYYTLSNEIELDPEIAADLAFYVKS